MNLLVHSANEKLKASRITISRLIENCDTRLSCIYDGAGAFNFDRQGKDISQYEEDPTPISLPSSTTSIGIASEPINDRERAHWLSIRKNAVALNASSMPSICGGNYFQTPEQAARTRVLKGTRFIDPVAHDLFWSRNTNVQRGVQMESVAKRCFERITGFKVAELSSSAIFTNKDVLNGMLGGTPDGFIIHSDGNNDYPLHTYPSKLSTLPNISLLEIKCPKKCSKGSLKNYYHQLQSYLHLFGLEQGYLFQYVNENDHMLLTIERDSKWIEEISPHVDHFIRLCEIYDIVYSQSLFNAIR